MLLFYPWAIFNLAPPIVQFIYKTICGGDVEPTTRGVYQVYLKLKDPVPPGTDLREIVKKDCASEIQYCDNIEYICDILGGLGVLLSCIIAPFLALIFWYVADLRAKYEHTYRIRVSGLEPFQNMVDRNGKINVNAGTATSYNNYNWIDFLEDAITVYAVQSRYF